MKIVAVIVVFIVVEIVLGILVGRWIKGSVSPSPPNYPDSVDYKRGT